MFNVIFTAEDLIVFLFKVTCGIFLCLCSTIEQFFDEWVPILFASCTQTHTSLWVTGYIFQQMLHCSTLWQVAALHQKK